MEPKYTLETFLELLKEEAKDWKFELKNGVAIRACDKKETHCGCPIDVAFAKLGANWVDADSVGNNYLSTKDCYDILEAADNPSEKLSLRILSIRDRILDAVGL